MHACDGRTCAVIDVSIQEALATIAITELARPYDGRGWSRKRLTDGNGATVCILPARDGFAAISPRDDHQWAAWLTVMGVAGLVGAEPRFKTKPDRVANWDALHALMSERSRHTTSRRSPTWRRKRMCRAFLREPVEQLASPQLAHRGFWNDREIGGRR